MRRYLLWMSALMSLALADSASAVPVIGDPVEPNSGQFFVVNAGGGIPANGALLIQGPYDTALAVSGLGSSGPQDGTLTHIEDSPYWVWRPSAPFVAGTRFEVELSTAGFPSGVVAFDIVAAIELAQPPVTLAPSASLLSVISERACCRARLDNSSILESTPHCFGTEYESSIRLDSGIATLAPRLLANQYLFRFTTGDDQRPSFADGSLRSVVLPVFREQAQQYCFELTAIELPTLTELSYDASMSCAEHGALGDLGTSTEEPGQAELTRSVCQAPPAGLEDAWCEVNAACEDGQDDSLCGLYPHVCEGEPLRPVPSSVDAGTSDTGPAEAQTDASADRPAGKGGGDGCSVTSAAHARGPAPVLLAWALGLGLAACARRRGREAGAKVCQRGA
jgi:hypothetical protein